MKFVHFHYCARNDGYGERSFSFEIFDTKDEAIESAMEDAGYSKDQYNEEALCVKDFLENGGRLWIYEWERKGNGDEIRVIETEHPERYSKECQDFLNKELVSDLGFEINGNGEAIRFEDVIKNYKI
ncbi:hypothetical protein QLL95_gp0145 [Cotonvirus japonicus]|uniref:Phage protein n=1 Tax=Cotonvirus japonicus TaxID=2811091 RepID=A0ABM7NR61_9VIRU|nr:hypothetical protein QLL95_gp0145 [Cotonvirus japonicus]BCS82634.1 hypothetical protein [Cotonvirus japonicus]